MKKGFASLLARVTEDGYLLYCSSDFVNGWYDRYWPDYFEDNEVSENEGIETIEIEVPATMVQDLLDHGTSQQVYSDGYEAWQDILKFGTVRE